MYGLKNYRGVMSNDTEDWWTIWRRIDLPFQNWRNQFDEFWLEHKKVSIFCTLMGCFWPKYVNKLNKFRGVIFHDMWEWCKIWRKTDLWFGKCHDESLFRKSQKLGLWWDPVIQSRKCMSLIFTGELCVMTMKNDPNLKKNWLVNSKFTWGI